MLMEQEELLTPREVAEMLRVEESTISRYVNHADPDKRLPAYRLLGNRIRISRKDLMKYLETHKID